MGNMREIRDRIKSINDIMKITNAMYLISSSKLKKAKKDLAATQPYFNKLVYAMRSILSRAPDDINMRYFDRREEIKPEDRKVGYIVITADKGMCGSYNHNVIKLTEEKMAASKHSSLFVMGQVGRLYFQRRSHAGKLDVDAKFIFTTQNPTLYRARQIAEQMLKLFEEEKPDVVVLAAAKVGGINANNTAPAEFAYENMQIQCNVIKCCHDIGVKKLLFLGSTCIYPKLAPQPIPEDALLTGPLEATNEAYAIAKIAGLEMCKFFKRQYGDDFISCMPTNLYGPHDNYDLQGSHVLPAMIRKFHEAKVNGEESVELWGTGTPLREFLYVDDMADACVFLLENYSGEQHVNIGTGKEVTIRQLAETVQKTVGFEGKIVWNTDMPDGTPRKLTDVTKLHGLGWTHRVELEEGVKLAYDWFKDNIKEARK